MNRLYLITKLLLCVILPIMVLNVKGQRTALTGFEDFTAGNWTYRSTPPFVSTPAGVTIGVNGNAFTSDATATFQIDKVIYVLAPYYTYNSQGTADKRINRLFAYDIYTDTWSEKKSFDLFTNGIYRPGFSFAANGLGFIGGGYSNFTSTGTSNNNVNNLYCYDPTNDSWSSKGSLPVSYSGYLTDGYFSFTTDIANSTTQTSGNVIVLDRAFVGFSNSRFYEYFPTSNTWARKNDFPGGTRYGSQATFTKYFNNTQVLGESGFVYGGYDGTKFTNRMWEFSLLNDTWYQLGVSPYDSGSANNITATERRICVFRNNSEMAVYDPQTGNWRITNSVGSGNSSDKIMGGQYFWKGKVFYLHSDITSPIFKVFDASKAIEDVVAGSDFQNIYCNGDSMFIPVKADWVDCNGTDSIKINAYMDLSNYNTQGGIKIGKTIVLKSKHNSSCFQSIDTVVKAKIPDGYTASSSVINLSILDTTNGHSDLIYYAGNNVYTHVTIDNNYYSGNILPITIIQNTKLPIAGQHGWIKGQAESQYSTFGSFNGYGDLHWKYPNEFDDITATAYASPNNSESYTHQFTTNSLSDTLSLNGRYRFYDVVNSQYRFCATDVAKFPIKVYDTLLHSFGSWQLDGNTQNNYYNIRTVGGVANSLNGKIYFGIGGEETLSGGQIFYTPHNDWYVYDPITKTTNGMANYPSGYNIVAYQNTEPIHHPFSFVIGDYIYVGGGLSYNNTPSKLFFRYDPINNKWDRMADLPVTIFGTNSFSINDKGYVVFGQITTGNFNSEIYQYDVMNNYWYDRGSTNQTLRYNATSFCLGDKAYFVGGLNNNNDSLNDVIEMDSYGSIAVKNNFPFGNIAGANGFSILNAGYLVPALSNQTYRYYNSSDTWEVGDTITLVSGDSRFNMLAMVGTDSAAYAFEENDNNYELVWKFNPYGNVFYNSWTGAIDQDWNNAGNWWKGVVPGTNEDVAIGEISNSRYPVLSSGVAVNNLSLLSKATLSLNGDSLTINAKVTGDGKLLGSDASTVIVASAESNTLNFGNSLTDSLLNNLSILGSGIVNIGSDLGITNLLNVSNGVLNTNGKLTLISSANATAVVSQVTGVINGDVTVERYIPQGYKAYRELSSGGVYDAGSIFNNWQESGSRPVGYGTFVTGAGCAGCTTNGINANTGLDYTYYGNSGLYNYSYNNWSKVTNSKSTNLDPFTGYHLLIYGDRNSNLFLYGFDNNPMTNTATVLRTKGKLVTGNVTYSEAGVTNDNNIISNTKLVDIPEEGSFIANPYSCALDWNTLGKTNLAETYWYFDPTYLTNGIQQFVGYNTYSGNSNPLISSMNQYIQPGQAFWVQADASTAGAGRTLTITESNKVTTGFNTPVFKGGKINRIVSTLWKMDNNAKLRNIDGVVAAFNANFSKSIDKEDSKKFWNNNENISIVENGKDLCINGLPNPNATDSIFLKLTQMTANKTYTLRLDIGDYTAVNGMNPYLIDRFLHTETALTADSNFVSFTSTTSAVTYSNRFVIVFKPSTTLPVQFISINATHVAKGNMVKWVTADATDVMNYMVESSNTGADFRSINTIAINARNEYNYVDEKATGKTYYRIKAISKNGQINYSKIVLVNQEEKGSITVVPNPVENGNMNIAFNNMVKGNYTIVMYSRNGQEVFKTYMNIKDGSSMQIVPINQKVASGIYTIKLLGTDYLTNVIIK